uniref:Titin n=1 Tax=Catharus ustulatus TaxID=91951 RepID=A0A8C3UGG8_CATUS
KYYLLSLVLPTIDFAGIPQKTIHVPTGKPIELAIPIEGRPPPTASWFFAGSKLKESERIKTETTAKMAKLTVIDEVDANYVTISWEPPELDGGAALSGYVVEQRDAHRPGWLPVSESVTRTTFKFTRLVEGYRFRVLACNAGGPGEPAEVPGTVKITEMLEGLMVRQGGVIRLTIPIKGKPIPVCKWTKEGQDISKRAMIATSETHTELVIKDAEREDSGTYDLVLENKCGKKAVYIKVRVIGIPNPPEGPLEYDDIQARSVRVSWRPPTDDGGADILGYIVERREVPKTAWYTVDSRVKGTSLFTVGGLLEATEYEFRVFAENQTGLSRPRRTAMAVKTKLTSGEAPAIKKEMQDVTTKLGEAAQLTCQIVGRPLPDIKWYRFGKELVQSRKYKMSSDGRNHTLTVMTDEQEDEGLYTCMATNDVGEIETSGNPMQLFTHCPTSGTGDRISRVNAGKLLS